MKKKLLGGLLVVAIAAVAAFNVNMNTQDDKISMLALANVEALASSEAGITCNGNGSGRCYYYFFYKNCCYPTGDPQHSCSGSRC